MKKFWKNAPWTLKGLAFVLIFMFVLILLKARTEFLIVPFFVALILAYLNEAVMRRKRRE